MKKQTARVGEKSQWIKMFAMQAWEYEFNEFAWKWGKRKPTLQGCPPSSHFLQRVCPTPYTHTHTSHTFIIITIVKTHRRTHKLNVLGEIKKSKQKQITCEKQGKEKHWGLTRWPREQKSLQPRLMIGVWSLKHTCWRERTNSLPTACPLSSVCVQRHKQTIKMKGNRKALKAGRQQSKIQGDSLYVGELTKENKVERSESS